MLNRLKHFIRLARPKQWAKSAFVLLGPLYSVRDRPLSEGSIKSALIAAAAFAMASSACYIVNDIADAASDRNHPRKRTRPVASGDVTEKAAWALAAVLGVVGLALPLGLTPDNRLSFYAVLGVYMLNVLAYSVWLKHVVIVDVLSLACGFVLRVLAGCIAVDIIPSTWLLNVTLFLAMFLAFGKRLGERRTMGENSHVGRAVQSVYTDDLLRMFVVVTAVATLTRYAGYVETRTLELAGPVAAHSAGFNPYWLTLLPAMFAMLRAIVLLERGDYDDPTELATRDWPIQIAAAVFLTLTAASVFNWF